MLRECSPFQELCQVEKSPKASGGGRLKENKNNRTNKGGQVRPYFHVDDGKIPL
jgi:hypothetical protein